MESKRAPLPSKVYSKNKYSSETLNFSAINTLTLELKSRVGQSKVYLPQLPPPKKKKQKNGQLHFRDFSAMDRYARIFDGQDHFKSAGLGFNHIITSVHQGGRGKGRHPPTHHGRLKAQIPVVTMFSIPGTRLNQKKTGGSRHAPVPGWETRDRFTSMLPPKKKYTFQIKFHMKPKNCWFRKIAGFEKYVPSILRIFSGFT